MQIYYNSNCLEVAFVFTKINNICNFINIASSFKIVSFINETQQLETTKGTLFGAYNSITGYFQNVMHHKNDEAKLKSILFGNGFNKTQVAFNLYRSFAKDGIGFLN